MENKGDFYSHPLLLAIPKLFFPGHIYHGPRALGFLRIVEGEFLVVTSSTLWQKNSAKLLLNLVNKNPDIFLVKQEPDFSVKEEFENRLKAKNYKYIIGFGGGGVMDVAKVAGLGGLKTILIPTTAGSGSEVSRYSLFINKEKEKEAIADSRLLADTVLYDPSFLLSLSSEMTAYTTSDAYAHALEGLTSRIASPLSDLFALDALKLFVDFGPKILQESDNLELRSKLQMAGFLAGLAQSSASVGLIHALADFFGPRFGLAHGRTVALFLLPVIGLNLKRDQNYYGKTAGLFPERSIYEISKNFLSKMGLVENTEILSGKEIVLSDLLTFLKKDPAAKTHQFVPTEEEIKNILSNLGVKWLEK